MNFFNLYISGCDRIFKMKIVCIIIIINVYGINKDNMCDYNIMSVYSSCC